MTRYDFTTAPDRLGNHSVKWREAEKDGKLLPMWVADMDFATFPEMTTALQKFVVTGDFGYTYPSESLYQSIVDWEYRYHNYSINCSDIVLIEGVVPAISVSIQAFTKENDAVLINTPVYPPFARTVKLNNRKLITNSLIEKDGHFELDFEQLEKDIVANNVKLYLFCSPHNPGGRVWTAYELRCLGDLCRKHQVMLVSDEIHQDLALFDNQHHTFNTISDFSDFSVVLTSATKTFNIAGTKNSVVLIENERLRERFKKQQLANNQHEISTLGLIATETAYTYGKEWLAELKQVLAENINFLVAYFAEHAPRVRVMRPEGTYLVWLDFSDYGFSDDELQTLWHDKAKVILNSGVSFGAEGKGHARFNVAAPFAQVKEAVERLVAVLPR
ncbi:cysteine desulfhydrase [Lactococcus hodotermopsidis]|uniref:cysteine-S-conjugate beta-lyase n=1 Tax=Pseudolactococcus hodotermopsidis TaxID=2709157 RepID=A0A6A0BAC1_9LACT|nr:MalY/PatB family protein [Lactococcus hodotermopsidis]GFH42369.1 cysteine desulfhydrase [Lactococcus hodotermopsidis]